MNADLNDDSDGNYEEKTPLAAGSLKSESNEKNIEESEDDIDAYIGDKLLKNQNAQNLIESEVIKKGKSI